MRILLLLICPRARERQRRLVATRLHEIEGNKLTVEEVEMFEREAWPPQQRRTYILSKARSLATE